MQSGSDDDDDSEDNFVQDLFLSVSELPEVQGMSGVDYYVKRSQAHDDDNYGWHLSLDFDEYPLEIQCSACFL